MNAAVHDQSKLFEENKKDEKKIRLSEIHAMEMD